jgi:general secretion pathway protein A
LGNLEYGDEKLLQVLLLGQRELDDLLNRPDLWQLKQRIGVRLTISGLAPHEVEQYMRHRWMVAGGQAHPFSPDALERIKEYSKCIPRLINSICDSSLMLAFAAESRVVTAAHVKEAAEDLQLIDKPAMAPAAVRGVPIPPAKAVAPESGAAPAPSAEVAPKPMPAATAVAASVVPAPVEAPVNSAPVNGNSSATPKPAPIYKGATVLDHYAPTRKPWRWFRWGKSNGNGNGNR